MQQLYRDLYNRFKTDSDEKNGRTELTVTKFLIRQCCSDFYHEFSDGLQTLI